MEFRRGFPITKAVDVQKIIIIAECEIIAPTLKIRRAPLSDQQ